MSRVRKTTEEKIIEPLITFKGFDKNLQCRGFQFEVGKEYTQAGSVEACRNGFHACKNPLDVFSYYAPGESRFAQVEQSGELAEHHEDSKVASGTIKIRAELSIAQFVTAAFEYVKSKCEPAGSQHATGDSSASSATGYRSASSATGDRSASSATGDRSASITTGWYSSSEIKPSEDGKPLHAVAIAAGGVSKARAPEGSCIVLVERDPNTGAVLGIFASKVGENGIEANTWYTLSGGKVELA